MGSNAAPTSNQTPKKSSPKPEPTADDIQAAMAILGGKKKGGLDLGNLLGPGKKPAKHPKKPKPKDDKDLMNEALAVLGEKKKKKKKKHKKEKKNRGADLDDERITS